MPRTDFTIRRIEARRLAAAGSKGYWEGFVDGKEAASRFVFKPGWRTVYAREVESAIVRVEFDDGTVGWGEANAPIVPEVTCLLANNLLAPVFEGRSFGHPSALWDLGYDIQRGRGHLAGTHLDALAMIDIAVWDAVARRADLPLAAMIGGAPRRTIPAYLSGLRQGSVEERCATAAQWADKGLKAIKIFHDGDTQGGVAEFEALMAAAPGIEHWMVDVLWSLPDLDAACDAKAAYGRLGLTWLECPLTPEDLPGHRSLQQAPGAPIALGEHFHTRFEVAPWLDTHAIDILQPDVGRTGISEMVRLAGMAARAGVPLTPHMGSGLDIFQAATLQVASALGSAELPSEYQAGLAGRLEGAVASDWAIADGAFALPERPGIGVEVDEEALERFVVA